jgi:hypothetical protein
VALCLLSVSWNATAQPERQPDEPQPTEPDEPQPGERAPEEPKPAEDPAPAPAAGAEVEAAGAVAAPGARADAKAAGAKDEAKKDEEEKRPWYSFVEIGGYVQPGFQFLVRPAARPKDEVDYGFFGEAGLLVDAKPFEMWRASFELLFSVDTIIEDVEAIDEDNDEAVDGIAVFRKDRFALSIEHATIDFVPIEMFQLRGGIMRIPFSLQQQSANTQTVFPERSEPNEIFLSGADIGALAEGNFAEGIFVASFGVFNGDSLGFELPNTEVKGVVLAARADVNPFGEFLSEEGDVKRGPFRLGIGGGMMFRPATIYDERTGTEPRNTFDLRFAASLRMAYRGLYVGAEYFRRQQSDDFTFRPEVADGAYAQVQVFVPIGTRLGIEPAARVGFVAADQTFDPRFTGFLEGGVNFYPVADAEEPDAVKLTLMYFGERRFSEQEEAHGGLTAVQLKF